MSKHCGLRYDAASCLLQARLNKGKTLPRCWQPCSGGVLLIEAAIAKEYGQG